jgi:hypothetical protein
LAQDPACPTIDGELGPLEREPFFQDVMARLSAARIPYLVGGAYAFDRYTGIIRRTKDLDIFVRRQHCTAVLATLARAGYGTELTDSHWIAKAFCDDDFVDIIFNSGNGLCPVDDQWFEYAPRDWVLGRAALLCPPEEIIWQKSYIMERERFDGADVAHLLRACGRTLDWARLLRRIGDHWEVLLAHLILFQFIYPGDRDSVPAWIRQDLLQRAIADRPGGAEDGFRGTLLSRYQYFVDIENWGYHDARLDVAPLDAA